MNRSGAEAAGRAGSAAAGGICLLNDSFPPLIDGVANAVVNYARVLRANGRGVFVVTPENPDADDSGFDYPVVRYPALDLRASIGYTAGNPLAYSVYRDVKRLRPALLHSHCPVMSNLLARVLRADADVPFIMTYHTKFDVDIANTLPRGPLRQSAIRALVNSVSACDELWAVSDGAGRNIQSLGYEGDYIVMPNGVDMPRRRAGEDVVRRAADGYDLPDGVPLLLFVGRLMWYKGIRLILDALDALRSQGYEFRTVFVGSGTDADAIRAYASELRLDDRCFFTGAVRDREVLTGWYTRADLLLFPSTFDTNGLVVREAAACSLGAVLVRGSCAAEGVTDRVNGLLTAETAASLAVCLASVLNDRQAMRRIGENACADLYYSWDDSVRRAMERYEIVLDNHRRGRYPRRRDLTDGLLALHDVLMDSFAAVERQMRELL